MAKRLTRIHRGKNKKEYDLHGLPDFPCEVYLTKLQEFPGGYLPDHWHSELEIGLVTRGAMKMQYGVNQHEIIRSGEGYFFNQNVTHAMKQMEEDTIFITIVFHENLIKGPRLLNEKYIDFILSNPELSFLKLNDSEILSYIQKAYLEYEEKSYGYELAFRNIIGDFWLYLSRNNFLPKQGDLYEKQEHRMDEMLLYISKHYHENIQISSIADSVNISTRECQRCFRKHLKTSPNLYLMQYRLNHAAQLLVSTDYKIEKIAKESGFSSAGYFSTQFKKLYGMRPSNYREMNGMKGANQ